MKVRIAYTVEVDDRFRSALNARYGKKGKATRKEIVEHFIQYGDSLDDDLIHEYEELEKSRNNQEQ